MAKYLHTDVVIVADKGHFRNLDMQARLCGQRFDVARTSYQAFSQLMQYFLQHSFVSQILNDGTPREVI